MSSYTVFIPRVFSNITEERISNVFHNLNIGSVEHVDLVPKTSTNGQTYNMAFVHFAMIYNTVEATKFRQEVEDPEKKAILQYDGPWFWLVLPFEQKSQEKDGVRGRASEYLYGADHVPPPYKYLMANMVPVWIMTTYGPALYLGCPDPQYNTSPPVNTKKMIPPQVAYGNRNSGQRQHPRKKIHVPRQKGENVEPRSATYAKEENHVSLNYKNILEDGEEVESDDN